MFLTSLNDSMSTRQHFFMPNLFRTACCSQVRGGGGTPAPSWVKVQVDTLGQRRLKYHIRNSTELEIKETLGK